MKKGNSPESSRSRKSGMRGLIGSDRTVEGWGCGCRLQHRGLFFEGITQQEGGGQNLIVFRGAFWEGDGEPIEKAAKSGPDAFQ